jgi:XTP/dITP diphosphohydrolase
MNELVIATGNPHKVEEIGAIFASLGLGALRLLSLRDIPGSPFREPSETGSSFQDNAIIKAIEYARLTGRPCLADDSGLEIDALNGRPGVISSHYATDGVETGLTRAQRDAANNERVLRELASVPESDRAARFRCVMVLADGLTEVRFIAEGTFSGRIGTPPTVPRGANGFGYDPLFLVSPEFTRTSAELSPAEKNLRSHRALAAAAMAEQLRPVVQR